MNGWYGFLTFGIANIDNFPILSNVDFLMLDEDVKKRFLWNLINDKWYGAPLVNKEEISREGSRL